MINKVKTLYHVSLAEAKKQIRLDDDFTQDDGQILALIKAATEIAENFIKKDIAKTTNVLTRYDFSGGWIRILEGNLISITSIEIKETPTPLSNFTTYVYRDYFKIELDSPVDTEELTVTFETGFDANKLPAPIKTAILIKIADLYDMQRSSFVFVSNKDTGIFETLLLPYQANHVDTEPEN